MSNTWFQFKQFTVQQHKAAMKVCTDACLFGGWVAAKIEHTSSNINGILDIGTGTGLLSLMLAQKSNAKIDAVEMDVSAVVQAKENFEASVWTERLKVIEGDIRSLELPLQYDLIISNPPFFENDLKSNDPTRNDALHSDKLTFEELVPIAASSLTAEGSFVVLLPRYRYNSFIDLAARNSLFLRDQVLISQTEKHSPFRAMLWFSTKAGRAEKGEITIKKEGKYSEEFTALLKDYYLYL